MRRGLAKLKGSNRGASTIEYLLVLAVVLMMFGLLRQFNDSFRAYVKNYYEDYLACLLETGELPTLGYEGGGGECDEEFQPFTLAAGRPIKDSTPFPVRAELGKESGSQAAKESQPKSSPDRNEGGASRGGSESREGGSGGTISAGPSLLRDGEGRSKTVPLTAADVGGERKLVGFGGNVDDSVGSTSKKNNEDYMTGRLQDDITGDANLRKSTVPAPEEEMTDVKARRVPAETNSAKKKIETDEAWSFPDFIKIILIIILLIIMFVFFGGQALQISKSGEK